MIAVSEMSGVPRIFPDSFVQECRASLDLLSDSCCGYSHKFYLQVLLSQILGNPELMSEILNSPERSDRGKITLLIRFLESGESGISAENFKNLLLILRKSQEKMLKKAFLERDYLTPAHSDYWKALNILASELKAKIVRVLSSLGGKINPRVEDGIAEA